MRVRQRVAKSWDYLSKHPTYSSIIGTIVGGILLAVIVSLCAFFFVGWDKVLPPTWAWIKAALSAIGYCLTYSVGLPVWFLILLSLAFARVVPGRLLKRQPTWKNERVSYVGHWDVGVNDTSTETFLIVLNPDGTAERHKKGELLVSGKWDFKDRGAHTEWIDGWRDVIEPAPHGFFKKAFDKGKFTHTSTGKKIK